MIRYALKCSDGHRFESWFQNAEAFDGLLAGGLVSCPKCGTRDIMKCLMTPDVHSARKAAPLPEDQAGQAGAEAQTPASAQPAPADQPLTEQAIAELKRKIEAEGDYVGESFAKEARAIHDGDAPERPIYGEARADEAIALIKDGVPVAPLPFIPTRKVN